MAEDGRTEARTCFDSLHSGLQPIARVPCQPGLKTFLWSPVHAVALWFFQAVDTASPALGTVPEDWQPIARSGDAEERRLRAMALWNRDFLDLLPEFAETAAARLADVRASIAFETPVLVYVFDDAAGGWLPQVGWAPLDPAEPRLWSAVPAPLQTFLRQVHAGFVAADGESFGPLPPRAMETLAEMAGSPDGDPDWDEDAAEDGRILYTRLMQIAKNKLLVSGITAEGGSALGL